MGKKRSWFYFLLTVIALCWVYAACYHIFLLDYEYEIEDNAAIITYYKGSEPYVIIPATLGGTPVKEIGREAFSKNASIRTVVIPDGVTKIGYNAFSESSLEKVQLPGSVTEIGVGAFADSTLTSVDLPENLKEIWNYAFSNCVNLQAIKIPAKVSYIDESFVVGCSHLKSIEVSGQNNAFVTQDGVLYTSDMETLLAYPAGRSPEDFKIPESVTRIAEFAFCDSTITSVSIPEGVVGIYDYPFLGCKMLRRIDLPASLTTIEDCFYIFGLCDNLECINVSTDNQVYASMDGVLYDKAMTKLLFYPLGKKESSFTAPNGIHSIEKQAFYQNENLVEVILPDGAESIGEDSYAYCEKLERIMLPDGLKSIGYDAFSCCKNLKNIVLPDSLTSLGGSVFELCRSLKEITIPKGITSIYSDTFNGCEKLERVMLPDSLKSIGDNAFDWCEKLEQVMLPDNLSSIGDYAFRGCRNLKSVILPGSLTSLGESAFSYCDVLASIFIPSGVTSIEIGRSMAVRHAQLRARQAATHKHMPITTIFHSRSKRGSFLKAHDPLSDKQMNGTG
jgi:hypothetical protein